MNYIGAKRTWLQILFWGGLWLLIPLILSSDNFFSKTFYRSLITFAGIAILIYINLEVLLPQLYFQKRQTAYIFAAILLIALLVFLFDWDLAPWAEYISRKPNKPFADSDKAQSFFNMCLISYSMPFFTSLIGSTLFEVARYASNKEKESVQLQKEKLEAEMNFLKSQINPHFLFNALNNIYTLTVIKSDLAPDNLLKLSDMLRYMLYECKADKVPLHKEITYIENFIDLYKLKDSSGLNIEVEIDKHRPDLMIAPLLFVPFIENAFKHSKIEDTNKGWIRIGLKVLEQKIVFEVTNSIPSHAFTKDKTGGIGLQNVKRQLELMYPQKHDLQIEEDGKRFRVLLEMEV
ncbi:MAG: histidine kinase [Chitinophagales bacterium]